MSKLNTADEEIPLKRVLFPESFMIDGDGRSFTEITLYSEYNGTEYKVSFSREVLKDYAAKRNLQTYGDVILEFRLMEFEMTLVK